MPPDLEEKVKFFGKKKLTLGKCSNFFVFQPILIKMILESDLVLNRSFPESFYDLMIFDTPYAHISEKIDDFGSHPQNHQFFRKYEHRGTGIKNHQIIKTLRK